MSDFERDLSEQLRRIPAPEDLAGRVMHRVRRKRRSQRVRRWVAAVLLGAAFTGGAMMKHQHDRQEQAEARDAAQQFELAMRITGDTLQSITQQVIQPNLPQFEEKTR